MSGKPAARIGDKVSGGVIVSGSSGVLIGDSGAMACSVCPGGVTVGSPVNPQLGAKVLLGAVDLDFWLPGALPLIWQRQYSSYVNAQHGSACGMLGYGWKSAQQIAIELKDDACLLLDAGGRAITFEALAPGQSQYSASEDLHLMRGGPDAPWARQRRWAHLSQELTGNPDLVLAASGDSDLAWVFAANLGPTPAVQMCLIAQLDRFGRSQHYGYSQGMHASAGPGGASLPAGLLIGITDGVGRSYRLTHQRIHGGQPARGLLHADTGWRLIAVTLVCDPLSPLPTGAPLTLVRYSYSAAGDLTAVHDRSGALVREFEYDDHRISAHRHQGGPWHRYRYESSAAGARVIEHTNQEGLAWRFEYLSEPPSPEGVPRAATRTSDSLGRVQTYHFEGQAGLERLTRHERADGSALHYSYDGAGRLASSTDPLGRITRMARDGAGRITGVITPGAARSSQQWDEATGRLLQSQDASGAATSYRYDAHGRLIEITQADGSQEHYRYPDPQQSPLTCDSPREIEDAQGGVKQLHWSDAGLLVRYTDCSQRSTAYRHDRFGELIEVQDALGGRTVHERDAQGRISATTLANGQVERYGYNAQGQLSRIEPQGSAEHAITLAYDLWGRLTQRTHGGLALAFEYDSAGRLTRLVNENGAQSRFAWDVMDRLVQEEGFDERVQGYEWDAAGQLTQAHDGNAGQQSHTRYRWSEAGQLVERTLPATAAAPAQVQRYEWDQTGRLMAASVHLIAGQQPQLQSRIEIERDLLGRITGETQRLYRQDANGKEQVEFEHTIAHRLDALGNRQASNLQGAGSIEWLLYGSGHVHGLAHEQQSLIDFERDALHRETRRSLHGAAPLHIARQWDSLGRLQALATQGLQGAASVPQVLIGQLTQRRHHYDALGQLAAIELPAQLLRYGYDGAGRLRAMADSLSPESQQRWSVDPAGNRLPAPTHKGQASDDWAQRVHAHWRQEHFNLLGQGQAQPQGKGPIDRWLDNRIGFDVQHVWRYDEYGNRVEQLQADGSRQLLSYDGAHQLIEVRLQPPAIGSARHDGQATTATGASTSRYIYDALGRRLKRSVRTSTHTALTPEHTHYYGWDGDRLIHTEQPLPEVDRGQEQRHITHTVYEPGTFTPLVRLSTTAKGPRTKPPMLVQAIAAGLDAADEDSQKSLAMMTAMLRAMPKELQQQSDQAMRLALQQGIPQHMQTLMGEEQSQNAAQRLSDMREQLEKQEQEDSTPIEIHFYHCDHLGTPLALTDQQGRIVWAARLDPWGNVEQEYNPRNIEQAIRLPGQHQDRETGLYYNRHRYYDPTIGFYINQDPIGFRGGIHKSRYPKSPLSFTDPLGLQAIARAQAPADVDLRPDGRPWGEGCGDASTDKYIPDSYFGKVNFMLACRKHDKCYGTFGNVQGECDDKLEKDMHAACDEANAKGEIGLPALCRFQGASYRFVLKNLGMGQKAFDVAQEEAFWNMVYEKAGMVH